MNPWIHILILLSFSAGRSRSQRDVVTLSSNLGASERDLSKFIKITRNVIEEEVTVQVNTEDGTARAGIDYTALTDHDVTFAAGAATAFFTVSLTDNEDKDGDKTFTLVVSGTAIVPTNPHTFIIIDDEDSRQFDCHRHNQDCPESTDKCRHLPMCECVGIPAREGDMCNIITEQKNGAACVTNNVDCNNGVCLDNSGTTTCACNPGYYGDNCEHSNLVAVCSIENMIFIANPHGNFEGSIYVKDKGGIDDCTATKVNDPPQENDNIDDTLKGYSVKVPHDSGPCGAITPEEFEEHGTVYIRYFRQFFIQYQTEPVSVKTGLDQIVSVSCKLNKNNLIVKSGIITLDPNGPFTQESTSAILEALTLTVEMNGSPVTADTVVHVNKKLCVTLRIPEEFSALEIIDIAFNNALTADDLIRWLVFISGCPEGNSKTIYLNGPYYPVSGNKRIMTFCFRAFAFDGNDKLAVEIKVKICLNPDECQLRSETCGRQGNERRKRQTDSSRLATVGATFTVRTSGSDQTDSKDTEVKKEVVCDLPFEFVPTVIALGVVIFCLVLLCLFLTYRIVRKTPQKDERPPESVYHKR